MSSSESKKRKPPSGGLSDLIATICNENGIIIMTWQEFYLEHGAELIERMKKDDFDTSNLSQGALKVLSSESKKRKRDDNPALHVIANLYRAKGCTVMNWKDFYAKHGAELIKRMKEDGTYDPEDSQDVLELCVPGYFPKIVILGI